MKKIVILLTLLLSWSFADSALLLKKGWQLIGATSKIEDMSKFESKNVEQIWHFDAGTQKWKGYSPDSSTQNKITEKGYAKINSLDSWHGFWVKSKGDWALTFKEDTVQVDDNITLKKGWNLISLPINSVVSAHIFDDHTLWKYSSKDEWEFFAKEKKEDFPIISHITNSEGIWVKSNKDQKISVASESAKLHNFDNLDDAKAYIRDMVLSGGNHICGYYPMVNERGGSDGVLTQEQGSFDATNAVVPKTATVEKASGTNLQEQGIDESDIVKHNNTNIFYISKDTNNFVGSTVNVTTFENITNNSLKPSQTIELDGYADSMYLVGNRLIVLSRYGTDNYKAYKKDGSIDDAYRDTPTTLVDVFNVADISNIQKVTSYKINGTINSSRVKDSKMFLVTTFHPSINYSYPHRIYVDAPECKEYFRSGDDADAVEGGGVTESSNAEQKASRDSVYYYNAKCYGVQEDNGKYYKLDYDRPEIKSENLLPYMQKDDAAREVLLEAKTFFAPNKKDQQAVITTVSLIDITSASLDKTTSLLGYNNTIYASPKALYLVSNQYPRFFNFDRYEERSMVYKVTLDSDLAYKASGFVNGSVLNQFSLSEYQDILRIATTEGNSWQNDTTNSVFTMENISDSLLIKGVLSGLGEEGETIKSVRFMGERGYVVTFRQTDPFYTIDLSNPASPKKAGELKINGFSAYLHPIDENHILGIGRDATPAGDTIGLKLELFDISDFSNPVSQSSYSFGSAFSYSEMLNNHKALAYETNEKLLGFSYDIRNNYKDSKSVLGVFQIENNAIKAYKTIDSPVDFRDYNQKRGLIFDFEDKTYIAYFANGQIAYSSLNDLKEQ